MEGRGKARKEGGLVSLSFLSFTSDFNLAVLFYYRRQGREKIGGGRSADRRRKVADRGAGGHGNGEWRPTAEEDGK